MTVKVPIKVNFITWLLHQTWRKDPVGDLARDVVLDIAEVAAGVELEGVKIDFTWKDLYRHIHSVACKGAKLAVVRAGREWRQSPILEGLEAPEHGGVYCVSYETMPHLVKIGRAKNIRKRLNGLSSGAPGGIVLRAILSLDPKDEKAMHARFEDFHLKGEWFRADLLQEI